MELWGLMPILGSKAKTIFLFAIRYKVAYKKETGECRLEISMTFADDAGEYSIFVKNPHGEASASAGLLEEGISILLFLHSGNLIISEFRSSDSIFYLENRLNVFNKTLLDQWLTVFLS